MDSHKKNIRNLILFIIAILLISATFYAGVIYTTSSKLEKAERVKYLAATENTTNRSNTSNSTNSSSSKSSSNTSSATTQSEESSNANLKMLGIRPSEYDFSGFKSGTTTYEVTVPLDVEEVEVYGTAQDSKAKVSGLGTKKLEEGLNDLSIVVTAEDGTEKIYTIQVTRESSESSSENTEGTEASGEGLSSLKIGDLELSPSFSTNVYEYTAKYIGEGTEVDVEATATNPEYTVEITGNDGLKEGENIVTILVTDTDGGNVATYQVTVNKSLVDEEAIAREQEEARKKEEQRKMIIIGVAVGVVVLIIIIALIVRHRRNKAWAEEYTVPFSGLNDDDEFVDDKKYQKEQEQQKSNEEQEQSDNTENVDDEEVWTKEKARKQFLDDYDNSNIYHDQERASKRKHRGKRFK